jgi:hypothetical protein
LLTEEQRVVSPEVDCVHEGGRRFLEGEEDQGTGRGREDL